VSSFPCWYVGNPLTLHPASAALCGPAYHLSNDLSTLFDLPQCRCFILTSILHRVLPAKYYLISTLQARHQILGLFQLIPWNNEDLICAWPGYPKRGLFGYQKFQIQITLPTVNGVLICIKSQFLLTALCCTGSASSCTYLI